MEPPVKQSDNNSFIDFDVLFARLNELLAIKNITLDIICTGGYVMQMNGYRATADIDAFYQSDETINNLIKIVGDEFGLNTPNDLWLNNSVANMNPLPPDAYCEIVRQSSHLLVKKVNLIYLIGMKLYSARGQDMKDIADILKDNATIQPFELISELNLMGFDIDISLILDAFEGAYGMDWLKDFYLKNEAKLLDYF